MSTGRPQRLPLTSWNPVTSVMAGSRVRWRLFQASHSTAGERGGTRFHEPCAAMTAPPDQGIGMAVPSRNDMPSGADVGWQPDG